MSGLVREINRDRHCVSFSCCVGRINTRSSLSSHFAPADEVTSLCSFDDGCLDGSEQEAGQLDEEPDPLSVPTGLLAPLSPLAASGEGGDSDASDKEEALRVQEEEEEEEVFTFSSRPHSARRVQGLGNSVQDATFDLSAPCEDGGGVRREVLPEDDFIGSESEEVCGLG